MTDSLFFNEEPCCADRPRRWKRLQARTGVAVHDDEIRVLSLLGKNYQVFPSHLIALLDRVNPTELAAEMVAAFVSNNRIRPAATALL